MDKAASMWRLLIVGFISTLVAPAQQPSVPEEPTVIDICDLMQDLDKFNGAVVAVRGYYRFAMELGGLHGRSCPKKLVLDGKERAQALYLEYDVVARDDNNELDAIVHKLITTKDARQAVLITVIGKLTADRGELATCPPLGIHRSVRAFGHLVL